MTVRTRAQLNADANSALPDNVAGEISPADVRQRIKDLADSARLAEDLGDAAGKNVGSGANDVAAGNHGHGAATSGAPGFMAAADKQKLDGIEAGAEVNAVSSVAGKTGVVTLVKGDVGLGNVDNTSDTNKPISTATQNALNAKAGTAVATTSANGLMSSADKTKLNGIEAGAQVNTVASVAGKTGAVTLAKGDVGLGNVDNTSDASKPISTATQNALDDKAETDLSNVSQSDARSKVGTGTMAYRDVTISTSDPSGSPANGTVWLKV